MERLLFHTPKALRGNENEAMLEIWKQNLCKFCNCLEDGMAIEGKLTDEKLVEFFEGVEDIVYGCKACIEYKLDPIVAFCEYDLMEIAETTRDYLKERLIEDEEGIKYVQLQTLKKAFEEAKEMIKAA